MAFSKIAAAFTMNTSGMEAGSRRIQKSFTDIAPAIRRLEAGLAGLNRGVNTLVFTQLAGLATKAAAGLGRMATASASSIDNLSKLSQRAGIAYADMAALEMAGNLAGIGVDQMANAMSRSEKMFDEARRGSASATEAFQRLGLDIADLDKMSSGDRFESIATAIAGLPDPAARAAAAMQIFGRSGAEMLPMFAGMADAMAQAQADTQRFGLALTDLQGRNVEAMNDSFTRAGYALSGMATQITAEIAPAIEAVATMFTDLFQPGSAEAFADSVLQMGWDFVEVIGRGFDLAMSLAKPVVENFQKVFSYFGGMLPGWGETIDWWAVSVEVFQRAISLFQGIGTAFVAGWKAIVSSLASVASKILEGAAFLARYSGFSDTEATLSNMAESAARTSQRLWQEANADAAQAGELMGNAFSETFQPTEMGTLFAEGATGGFEDRLEAMRAEWEADRAKAKEEAEQQRNAVKSAASLAFVTPDFQSALDVRSKEGYAGLLKSLWGPGATSLQQLEVAERQVEVLEGIQSNTEDMGLEAADI